MKPAALEPRTARIATWTLLAWEQLTLEGNPTQGKQKAGQLTNHILRIS